MTNIREQHLPVEPERETKSAARRGAARASRSERTRRKIVDAAETIFGREGYHAASIVDITRKAGVAMGTFYLYFPSKSALYGELLRTRNTELRAATRDAVRGVTEAREIVTQAFGAFFRWIGQHASIYRVIREAEFVDEDLRKVLYYEPVEEQIVALTRAMDGGRIPADDAEVIAWSMAGMAEFMALRWIIWGDEKEIPPDRFEGFIDAVLRLTRAPVD